LPIDDKGDVELPPLPQGAYEVFVTDDKAGVAPVASASSASTPSTPPPNGPGERISKLGSRLPFACERGGDEWADSRPGPELLKRIAFASQGKYFASDDTVKLSVPAPTFVSTDRVAKPIAPTWVWAASGAFLLGIHWIARRTRGLP